ncbi:MAG TPA: gas vesicle protein GvpD P-loop domain-containing protein [Methanotrichaceae archaeon]|nr:gas vesicle protein GvpD P-loop domain-containing protein [Methanotrichaceae archaeon]
MRLQDGRRYLLKNAIHRVIEMHIPTEIRDFFQIEKGQTLLIKGLPGTGKTTLALEVMNTLCEKNNGLYISTRVDPNRLYATNPWIKDALPPKNVINATQTKLLESLKGVSRNLTNYYAVLDFFKVFFDEAEEMDNPMIIIDSWDAVLNYTSQFIGDAQHSFEQNICEFARDLDTHLIFVSEFSNVMPLDYIVDGVATMENLMILGGSSGYEGSGMRTRYARQIKLDKLRGVEIRQKTYTSTLHGGRFRYFEPYREHRDARIVSDMIRVKDPAEDRISTGIPDLDAITGGLKYGSCNVIEIDHGVGKRYYQILTALASNAIKNGRGVFILPSIGYQLSSRDIFVPTNVAVSQPEGGDPKEWGRGVLQKWDELRERTGRPILNIIGLDAIEFAFGYKELLNLVNLMMRKWKETNDINVLIVKTGQESLNMAIHTADTYYLVNELNGGLCLYGIIPRTEPFNMLLEDRNRISLTPIV